MGFAFSRSRFEGSAIWSWSSATHPPSVRESGSPRLIATSGVFAIIVGLALQSTLADVFSGIALNLSKPYGIGDWVALGNGIEGKVVETNWRATHFLNGANDLVIVPNSDLAKARLTNLSIPQRSHGVSLTVRFKPHRAPSAMVDVMRSVLLSGNSILAMPEPTAQVKALTPAQSSWNYPSGSLISRRSGRREARFSTSFTGTPKLPA